MNRVRSNAGFTLLELLVVIGIAAAVLLAFATRPNDSSAAAALSSAEAQCVSLLSAARLRAVATGRDVRLVVAAHDRTRIALQQQSTDSTWLSVEVLRLPPDVALVPHASRKNWPVETFGMSSTALSGNEIVASLESDETEVCEALVLNGHGNTGTSGTLILARVIGNAIEPHSVRSIEISTYGIPRAASL